VLEAWRGSRVDRIVVVAHPEDHELARRCQGERTTVVTPAVPPPEMKDSVAAGLRHVETTDSPTGRDCWLLAPADLPRLSTAAIDCLLAEHERASHLKRSEEPVAAASILVPVHAGRRGHPVLFPWALAAEVFALSATEGVNQLLRRHEVVEIPCGPEAVGDDVDTLDDYRRLASSQHGQE
jgi:molybdenum cofactor cytidylyltransferase